MKEQQRPHHRHDRYISRRPPNIQTQRNNRFRSIPLRQHKRDKRDERPSKKSNDNRGVPCGCVTPEVERDDEKCEPGDEEAHAEEVELADGGFDGGVVDWVGDVYGVDEDGGDCSRCDSIRLSLLEENEGI